MYCPTDESFAASTGYWIPAFAGMTVNIWRFFEVRE
jgi:hypothetical protein